MSKSLRVVIERLQYRIQDVRSDDDVATFLQVMYVDSIKIQNEIRKDRAFSEYVSKLHEDKLPMYIEKSLMSYDTSSIGNRDHILIALLLIKVCIWRSYRHAVPHNTVLLLRRRVWFHILQTYALSHGVKLSALPAKIRINYRGMAKRIIPSHILNFVLMGLTKGSVLRFGKVDISKENPRIATEYFGHLNLERPERYSDLFFWQNSDLQGKDVLVTFNLPSDPLDQDKFRELERHGIQAVALSPFATKLSYSTLYNGKGTEHCHGARTDSFETRWMIRTRSDFDRWRSYWKRFFEKYNIKVYTSWFKYDANHLAIADAIQSLGGIATIYQRSCQLAPIPSTAINVDVEFGFSRVVAEMESANRSNISYFVITGYFGDHRFSLVRNQAQNVRRILAEKGAVHVMAYFDENTIDDSRWYLGHDFTMTNYAFLLKKVLDDKNFGLVLKPKNPRTLIRRLGPVGELLNAACATGRCYIFLDGAVQGSDTPALAALSADVAVHDGITSPTAGMESAFCGVRTLLLDREGWPISNLYELGINKVVFKNWQCLWEAYDSYRKYPESVPGFGDWSPKLDEMDPFRDGRAAERIGTYLKWLLYGFKSGLKRDTILADAAERYCKQWGHDKISMVKSIDNR